MKELYIRKGNLDSNRNILIIGEESNLGGRDSAYRAKGTLYGNYIVRKDPFSGSEYISYIHACRNIPLNSNNYSRDYDIHKYIKSYCKDILKWDGEANEGYTDSREAFIVRNDDVEGTVKILRERIISLVYPEGFFETVKSHYVHYSTNNKQKSKLSRRSKKFLFKVTVGVIGLFIYLCYSCVQGCKEAINRFQNMNRQELITDKNYDYRNKMSDENDAWLYDKCLHIICEEGGKAEWLNEAYYSKRFSASNTFEVHFYGDYTVIRIKKGLSSEKEQTAIYMACRKVIAKNR